MSFNQDIENYNRNVDKQHLAQNQLAEVHPHGKDGFKSSQQLRLPPMNTFGGLIRSKPQSGFNQTSLISGQGQLDFHLNSSGYVKKLVMEIELSCANPVTILPHYLIDRIEIHSSENNIIQTIYGDNLWFGKKMFETLEQHNRTKGIENVDSSYAPQALLAATAYRYNIEIPCFISDSMMKLNAIRDRVLFRVWFSTLGVTAGSASDITVSSCDILQYNQQLSGPLESLENRRKNQGIHKFRFLNTIRCASETLAMAASSQYDIRLTSANSMSAFLFFVIRAAPLTTNINTLISGIEFELLDKDNTIVGLKQNAEVQKNMSLEFPGDIFNYKNIFVLPFAIDTQLAKSGSVTGWFKFCGNELLRIYTNSTFTPSSYRIDVYSYEYNTAITNNGCLTVSK